jgi:hypothetical protein
MGIAIGFGVGSLALVLQSMPVDFKIEGIPPPPTVSQGPTSLAPPAPEASNPAPRPAVHWRPPIAVGFGQNVPLEFAVRQIAPRWVHVTYGDRVDSRVRVSWHGGRPWNQVLGGVLTTLGLHMKMSGGMLWIQG